MAQKVYRLLRCLDELEVKLRVRSGLVGATLALDRGVVLRNLRRGYEREGGEGNVGVAAAELPAVHMLWVVLERAHEAELAKDAARAQRQHNVLRNAIVSVGIELLHGVYKEKPPAPDKETTHQPVVALPFLLRSFLALADEELSSPPPSSCRSAADFNFVENKGYGTAAADEGDCQPFCDEATCTKLGSGSGFSSACTACTKEIKCSPSAADPCPSRRVVPKKRYI